MIKRERMRERDEGANKDTNTTRQNIMIHPCSMNCKWTFPGHTEDTEVQNAEPEPHGYIQSLVIIENRWMKVWHHHTTTKSHLRVLWIPWHRRSPADLHPLVTRPGLWKPPAPAPGTPSAPARRADRGSPDNLYPRARRLGHHPVEVNQHRLSLHRVLGDDKTSEETVGVRTWEPRAPGNPGIPVKPCPPGAPGSPNCPASPGSPG